MCKTSSADSSKPLIVQTSVLKIRRFHLVIIVKIVSFNNNNHPDIIEIDAASKTSADDIREIIESSVYSPLLGKRAN